MKKIFLLITVTLYFSSCEIINSPPPVFFCKSYIQTFIECGKISDKKIQVQSRIGQKIDAEKKILYNDLNKISAPYSISDGICLYVEARSGHYIYRDSSRYCAIPGIGRTDYLMSNGDDPNDPFYLERQRGYDKYIEMIGDTTFNWKSGSPTKVTAIITPVKDIVVTCDKNYTTEFPIGSNLSSLFTVFFDNPYATIKNGYKAVDGAYHYVDSTGDKLVYYPVSIIRANLAEVDFASLPFIGNEWNCHLDVPPDQTDTYTFYVKIILVDDTVLEEEMPVSIHLKGKN